VTILRLLAREWDNPMTLSEIARATEIHKATCAAVLASLVSHGCIRRMDGKCYVVGPEMVHIGFAYQRRYPPFAFARHEMFKLAEQTRLGTSICVPDGDELVILDMAGDLQPEHLPSRIGRRIPLAPPLGTIFKAWSSPDEVRSWLALMAKQYDLNFDDQVSVISNIRSRGYSLGSEQDFDIKLDAVIRRLGQEDTDLTSVSVALMLADKIRAYRDTDGVVESTTPFVDYIVGPVFDHRGKVVMSLQLFGAPGQIRRSEVQSLATVLLETTRRITLHISGGPGPSL
jgi:DNA-binding IclR family transcriptional regulator